jgi:hypothetical protein
VRTTSTFRRSTLVTVGPKSGSTSPIPSADVDVGCGEGVVTGGVDSGVDVGPDGVAGVAVGIGGPPGVVVAPPVGVTTAVAVMAGVGVAVGTGSPTVMSVSRGARFTWPLLSVTVRLAK